MSAWIDFKELRSKLSFEQVLRHYKVELKVKGSQHHGFCPLPNHEGKKNSPSFSANLEKKIFQCFGCGAKGNLLDFVVLMEGGKQGDGAALRNAALKLQKEWGLANQSKPAPAKVLPSNSNAKKVRTVLLNSPLNFELKALDFDHPYLRNRGFTEETIRHFGLGYCSKGYLQGRVVVPLHDQFGRLVGYAGRIVDDSLIDEENPRYKFPGQREHKGTTYEFRKSEFVYGGYRIKEPVDDLVVVEGFPSVWWLHQLTIPNCVGLMGWSCSETQAKLIVERTKSNGRVWLLSDGDDAGTRCAESFLPLIARDRFVRWIKLAKSKQPTAYPEPELRAFLNK